MLGLVQGAFESRPFGFGMWVLSRWMLASEVFGYLDEAAQVGDEGDLWNGARYGIGQTWTSDDDSKALCS